MGETVNPFASPTAVDQPPPPDCDSFYGTISRTFALSRRYKFFIRPGELLAGALPGGSRERIVRRSKVFLVVMVLVFLAQIGEPAFARWETEIEVIVAGLIATIVVVTETLGWLRSPKRGTRYDFAAHDLSTFQEIDRRSQRILASDVIAVKCHRGLNLGARRDTLELILQPRPGRPQRIRIELEGMFDRLGIEKALYEAGFPTMPGQWGHGA